MSSADRIRSRLPGWGPVSALLASLVAMVVVLALSADFEPRDPGGRYDLMFVRSDFGPGDSVIHSTPENSLALPLGLRASRRLPKGLQVRAAFNLGTLWIPVDASLDSHGSWNGLIAGPLPPGGCRHRLTIALAEPAGRTVRQLIPLIESDRPACRRAARSRSG